MGEHAQPALHDRRNGPVELLARYASVTMAPHVSSGGMASDRLAPDTVVAHPYLCVRSGVGLSSTSAQSRGSPSTGKSVASAKHASVEGAAHAVCAPTASRGKWAKCARTRSAIRAWPRAFGWMRSAAYRCARRGRFKSVAFVCAAATREALLCIAPCQSTIAVEVAFVRQRTLRMSASRASPEPLPNMLAPRSKTTASYA